MTDEQTSIEAPKKSWKREAGASVLLAALVVLVRYWFFMDEPAMVTAYGPAYSGTLIALVPTSLAVFGIHYIWRDKGK